MRAEHSVTKELSLTLEKATRAGFDARFVLSSTALDRDKDTIDPAAYAPNLGKRLIALWQHKRDSPVGFWENLKVEAGDLIGDIKFSGIALGQMVKQLVAEGVPLMASIGFRGKGVENDAGGIHFTALDIFETSIVSVGAQQRAVQIAKHFGITLPSDGGQQPASARAASSSTSAAAAQPHRSHNVTQKTISELVVEAQAAQVAARDKLTEATQKLGGIDTAAEEFVAQKAVVDELDKQLQAIDGKLASLKSAEARLATGAGTQSAAIITRRDAKDAENLLGKMALCVYESRVRSKALDLVAAERFPGSEAIPTLIKAAQNPAMSNVAGYAQELTRMAYGQFLDLLRSAAILPQCTPAAQSHSFDGANSIYVPTRLGGDVSGAFRAEGAPIPVKGLTFDHILLTPKNMGVIVTATAEMLRRSAIDLAAYFQSAIVYDTGKALDALFISATAGTAISPAGARAALNANDTRASSGATAAQITADAKDMLKELTSHDMGAPGNTRWLMHPSNLVALSMLLTATGSKQFPEAEQGRFCGYPVVTSTRLDPAIVLLIDFSSYTFALGGPMFDVTTVATIHEESAAPLPIASPGAPATVAAPARSLFQTNSWALRLLLDADWAKMRAIGPVQELTAVAW
jgi:HK97 family phage major capsid protein